MKNSRKTKKEPDRINELKEKIDNTEKAGKEIVIKGREFVRFGQNIVDLSQTYREALHVYTPSSQLKEMISHFNLLDKESNQLISQANALITPATSSSSGTATIALIDLYDPEEFKDNLSNSCLEEAQKKSDELHEIANREVNKQEVIDLMKSFDLDKAYHGEKCPLEFFVIAHNAFEMPIQEKNPSITSLIPIRSCINQFIEYLLKRRPQQEKCKGIEQKILSIGYQLRNDSLPLEVINSWAKQATKIVREELSPSKQKEMTRKDWKNRLYESTLFIKNLLTGLDPQKMKERRM